MAEPSPFPLTRTSQARTTNGDVYVQPSGGLVGIDLSGTWVATVFFEATVDWNVWYTVNAIAPDTGVAASFSTINGNWSALVGNAVGFRCRVASIVSGTVQVDMNGGSGSPPYQPVYIPSLPLQASRDAGSSSLNGLNQLNGVSCFGAGAAVFQISGTWVGTITFQGVGEDLTTFVTVPAVRVDTNPSFGRDVVTSTTTNGTFVVPCSGLSQVVAKMTAYTSGTATVTAIAEAGPYAVQPLPLNRGRNVKCIGMASSFRMVGNNGSPQNLMALLNGSSSAVLVGVRQFDLFVDSTAAQTNIFQAKLSRITSAPTGATTLTKVLSDTAHSSDANVTVMCGASADGTDNTMTATAGTTLSQVLIPRPHTVVGWFTPPRINVLPDELGPLDLLVLRPGEYLLLQAVTGTGANNVSTIHYVTSVVWEEFTYGS